MNGNWTYVFGIWKEKFRAWLAGMRRRRERRLKTRVAVALMRAQHLAQVFKGWKDHACDVRSQRAALGRTDFLETWRGMRLAVPFGFDSSRSAHSYLVSTSSTIGGDSLIRVPDSCEDRVSSDVSCGIESQLLVSRSVQTDEVLLGEEERIRFAAHLQTLDAQLEELIKVYEVKLKARPKRQNPRINSESSSNDEEIEHQGSLRNIRKIDEIHGRRSVTSTALRERVEVLKTEICGLRRKHEVLERKFSHTVEANKHRVELVDLEMKEMRRRLDELSNSGGNGVTKSVRGTDGVTKSVRGRDGCEGGVVEEEEREEGGEKVVVKDDGGGGPSGQKISQKGKRKQQEVLNPQTRDRKPQWK